jgi:hypothetical protein
MSFTRSNLGISNLSLFYGAEIIVFTEGGNRSFSNQEVEEGNFNNKAVDIKFWNGLFKTNNFSKRVEFRALGSKTATNVICDKIMAGDIQNTAVAKDKDLDFVDLELYDSPNILYTKGYSWENDVFSEHLTIEQVSSMLLEHELPDELESEIKEAYKQFKNLGFRLLRIELIFRSHKKKFITEVNGERFFNSKNSLGINKAALVAFIHKKKNEITRPTVLSQDITGLCPMLNNYGKLLASLSFNIINHICKKNSDYKSIPKQMLEMTMIERFINQQMLQPDPYYSHLISRLEAT